MKRKILSVILISALCVALLAGCAKTGADTAANDGADAGEDVTIRLASLKGPTTMGLVGLLQRAQDGELGYTVESGIYGAADEITGLIAQGSVDMAAVPCNLASTLYNKTEGGLVVAAVNTLGVLYVVETGESVNTLDDLKGRTVYSTGKGTTPEYVFNAILAKNGIDAENDLAVEYKSEATEAATALLTDGGDAVAVLPQPYVASVLAQNENARIALNLTEEWAAAGFEGDLVTGVVVISREFAASHPETVSAFLADYAESVDWVCKNNAEAAELIENLGVVASAAIAEKALPYCNIVCITGEDMKKDVSNYLGVLFEQNPKAVGGALPGDDFYYAA